ncbi:MAG: MBG domain-containing protein [Mucilaginibacter sp.]|uniref:MBG domain-containing protein n=1 Tax=Mucilaginibacter sp. TaxID=1882438 RepID=UPI0032675DF6
MKHIYITLLFFLIFIQSIFAQNPTLSAFTPAVAGNGTAITITGNNFTGTTSVSFGGTPAKKFAVMSATSIIAFVDVGNTGNIAVTNASGTGSLSGFVFIPAPNITYSTPQVYAIGASIIPLSPSNTGGAVPATIYGQTTTFAGNGTIGSSNGAALNSSFNSPTRLALDLAGNVFIADRDNNLIRKVSAGTVTTFASGFNQPNGVTLDLTGNVYIADAASNSVKKITPTGVVSILAGGSQGSANGSGVNASFYYPYSITIDIPGNLYVADNANNLIRKVTPSGVVSTIAGSGFAGFANGTGSGASFNNPSGIVVDVAGNLYLADPGNNRIRKITSAGVVTTLAGNGVKNTVNGPAASASFNSPTGVAIDAIGNIYVTDLGANNIRKIDPLGIVSVFAGSGSAGFANGISLSATFNRPNDVQIDPTGYVYVTDYGNNAIRKICTTGYYIDKALPPGLTFDQTTGIISGTPTTVSAATTYTITAYNLSGSSTTTVVIGVTSLTPQTITFPALSSVVYGAGNFNTLAISTNSTIPITYSSSNTSAATIDASGTIHIVGVGQTTITASQAGNASFSAATPVSQVLTVTPASINVVVNNQTKVYGTANPASTFNYTGFVYSETVSVITKLPSVTTTATVTSPVGIYPVNGSGAIAANYIFTYNSGTLTITPALLLIIANDQSRIYGIANPPLTVTYTGFITGDDASKLTTQPLVTTTATITSPIGPYPITVSGASSSNYTITYAQSTLTVTLAPRILTFDPIADKMVGDPDFDPGASVNTNDAITYTSSDPAIAIIVNGKIHVLKPGVVIITATVAPNANYVNVVPISQTLLVLDEPVRIVPVVTPNGDNINDVLRIDGIANYPDNRFALFNINGVKVYEIDGYDNISNVFNGHSNITGIFQPKGTYFYTLQFNVHGEKKRKVGYVVLKY